MIDQPERFLNFTATGWTAIGSIVSAVSIVVLSFFNFFYLRAARKQAKAAEKTLGLLHDQMVMSERPFVAIHSEYDKDLGAMIVRAVSQGSGPALDIQAHLTFKPGAESGQAEYAVGCLAIGESFQFLIGKDSSKLTTVKLRYKSISGQRWRTTVSLLGGSTLLTNVSIDKEGPTGLELALGEPSASHIN